MDSQARRVRQKLGFTQAQLADILGVHVITVTRWESGRLIPDWIRSLLLNRFEKVKRQHAQRALILRHEIGTAKALFYLLNVAEKNSPVSFAIVRRPLI